MKSMFVWMWMFILIGIAAGVDAAINFLQEGFGWAIFVDGVIILVLFASTTYILHTVVTDLRDIRIRLRELETKAKPSEKGIPLPLKQTWVAILTQFRTWGLTSSESKVAEYLIRGYSTRRIGALLKKSERTVRNQAQAVYEKAGMSGRSDLAAFFIREVLGEPDD